MIDLKADRTALEWVLSKSGTVEVKAAGQTQTLRRGDVLASDSFALLSVDLTNVSNFDPEDAKILAELPAGFALVLPNSLTEAEAASTMSVVPNAGMVLVDCLDRTLTGRFGEKVGEHSVNYLILKRRFLKPGSLAALKRLPKLESLLLLECTVSPEVLDEVEQLPHLKHLNLESSNVTNRHMTKLTLPALDVLSVWATPLTAENLADFKQRHPRVAFDGITDQIREELRMLIPSDAPTARPVDPPPAAIAPFDAAQAKTHQKEWAEFLGVPVEYTNSIGMKFVLIPPGEFMMGSTPAEIDETLKVVSDGYAQACIASEAPRHLVVLTKPFYAGMHEVTQQQFEAMREANPSYFSPNGEGKKLVTNIDTSHHPVEMVIASDVGEFLTRLTEKELPGVVRQHDRAPTPIDGGYRLLTEAEWEFACRAGTTTKFWFGDENDALSHAGWHLHNSGDTTHPVGELDANPFGLYDIHGNVTEWVQDGFSMNDYAPRANTSAINPLIIGTTEGRQGMRGGCFADPSPLCRSSQRYSQVPERRRQFLGFRAALSVEAVRQVLNPSPPPAVTFPGLEFDGVDDYVAIPSLNDVTDDVVTIEAIISDVAMPSSHDSRTIAIFRPMLASMYVYGLDPSQGLWAATVVNGPIQVNRQSDPPIPPAEIQRRNHVAAVFRKSAVRLFVEGQEIVPLKQFTKNNIKALYEENSPGLTLGCTISDKEAIQLFRGRMHAVRVSKGAKYSKAFDPPDALEKSADTIANYRFDEGEGEILNDSSGNGHHGKIVGAKWVPSNALPTDGKPGTFKNKFGMEFVTVPAGIAWLGGQNGVPGRREVPFEEFQLGVFEVTQDQWKQVMGTHPSFFSQTGGGANLVTQFSEETLQRFPLESVSWDDCQAFVVKLNQHLSEDEWMYRLPTEDEWEYACRGGPLAAKSEYGFNFYLNEMKNTLTASDANVMESLFRRTCEVGSYQPNRLGLYDMHGNVWEWCNTSPDGARTGLQAIRGGSWLGANYERSRANFHMTLEPEYQDVFHDIGLRLVRVHK